MKDNILIYVFEPAQDFGTFCICEQSDLRQACTNAQSGQSLTPLTHKEGVWRKAQGKLNASRPTN